MKKVLIVIGDVGGGHLSCARAIESAFCAYDGYEVKIVNLLQLSKQNKFTESVPRLISKYRVLELIFNLAYFLNNNFRWANYLLKRNFLNQNLKKSLEVIKDEAPDILILNYAPLTPVISKINELIGKKFKYVITVPDLGSISKSLADNSADLTFSPTAVTTIKLENWGVSKEKILEGYYPLKTIKRVNKQEVVNSKNTICEEFGFQIKKPIILVTGCGLGTVNIVKGIKYFMLDSNYQFIIIAGKDEKLRRKLLSQYGNWENVKIIGWAEKMLEYMTGADVTIAKPGPATVLELQKLGKKAIFTAPIGLQEYGNVEYLLKNPNFRFVGHKHGIIKKVVNELLNVETVEYEDGMKDAKEIVRQLIINN